MGMWDMSLESSNKLQFWSTAQLNAAASDKLSLQSCPKMSVSNMWCGFDVSKGSAKGGVSSAKPMEFSPESITVMLDAFSSANKADVVSKCI